MKTFAYAAQAADKPLIPFEIERREPGLHDIQIEILYCGVCHSDIHQARNEWGGTTYPIVPGHEVVGRVIFTGRDVSRYMTGDIVGVGCFVDSCRHCNPCREGEEQFCEGQVTWTYNTQLPGMDAPTYGGYSGMMIVDEQYAFRIDPTLDLSRVAPLLCAGITTWSPLKHWKAGPGTRLAVLGLGGLGHMAVKLGVSLGAEVTVISSTAGKEADAKQLGAKAFIHSGNAEMMDQHKNSFDLIINSVSANHDLTPYMQLLDKDGTLVVLGIPQTAMPFSHRNVITKRRSLSGSSIGGTKETQEMLDYCALHRIYPDVEIIGLSQINEAYERMMKNDVRYRFVIDLKKERA